MGNIYHQIDNNIKETVRLLSSLGVRNSTDGILSWEKIKSWVNQFGTKEEKDFAWLLLRYLIFRTSSQLLSNLRQSIKAAVTHMGVSENPSWKEALKDHGPERLSYTISPPILSSEYTPPGKSGDVITRLIKNKFGPINTTYLKSFVAPSDNERLIIVDDGAFTAQQLSTVIGQWDIQRKHHEKVAIALALAHTGALKVLSTNYPDIQVFAGEVLNEHNSLKELSKRWLQEGLWQHDITPEEINTNLCDLHGIENPLGVGNLGLMIGYSHGIPDNSIGLLWEKTKTWTPLIERP